MNWDTGSDPDRNISMPEKAAAIFKSTIEGNGCKYFMIFNNHEDEPRKGKLVQRKLSLFLAKRTDGSC